MRVTATGGNGAIAFFARRWHRDVPINLLFWRDMIVVGSLLNLAAAFAGLMALGFKAELPVALAVFHAPLPYNLFLTAAVWRTAELLVVAKAATVKFGAVAWLAAMTVL